MALTRPSFEPLERIHLSYVLKMPKSIFYIIFLILVINNVIISGWVVPTLNPHHPKKTDLVKNLLT